MTTGIAAGAATGIGSLPHHDPVAAAALVLRLTPDLPAVPQLPLRNPVESMIAQVAWGVPELEVEIDGSVHLRAGATFDVDVPIDARIVSPVHDGLIGFVDVAVQSPRPPRAVKIQVCGPLTFGRALVELGLASDYAYLRAANVVVNWAKAIAAYLERHLPGVDVVTFFDEPILAEFGGDDDPVMRDDAIDYLSTSLASVGSTTGIHVGAAGDARLALDAGPSIVGVEVTPELVEYALSLSRFLEGGGYIAWGAIPTDRPIGEHPSAEWKALGALWCELTRRGCDTELIRRNALVTPAHGLARFGVSQAERALTLTREIGSYVREQAIATRLTIGA